MSTERPVRYRTTSLMLQSADDLNPLEQALAMGGVQRGYVTQENDGLWYATLNSTESQDNPESTIVQMLDAIENLTADAHACWSRCSLREFNIGYDSGINETFGMYSELTHNTLKRIVDMGASVGITIYCIFLHE